MGAAKGAGAAGATPLSAAPDVVTSSSATDWPVELDGGSVGSDAAVSFRDVNEAVLTHMHMVTSCSATDCPVELDDNATVALAGNVDRSAGSESDSDAESSLCVSVPESDSDAESSLCVSVSFCIWWEIICRSRTWLARSREMRRLARSCEKRR